MIENNLWKLLNDPLQDQQRECSLEHLNVIIQEYEIVSKVVFFEFYEIIESKWKQLIEYCSLCAKNQINFDTKIKKLN